MVYQGSKNRLSKEIVPIIQSYIDSVNADCYVELFVGGANIIDKVKCKHKIGCDANENVIALLKYVQRDNDISIAPTECSFEHYKDVRANQNNGKYSKEYVSLIGYCASYGGRYFDGGYGKDRTGKRNIYYERVINLREQAPSLNDIEFMVCDYKHFDYKSYTNTVFYLDPPYKNTKQYGKYGVDYDEFYKFCEKLHSNGNIVIISEYDMPSDKFECVWSKQRKVMQKSDRTCAETAIEKLFVCK